MSEELEQGRAEVVERRYVSTRRFFTVECVECGVVLNSGHHYREQDRDHAEALADQHNQRLHLTPEDKQDRYQFTDEELAALQAYHQEHDLPLPPRFIERELRDEVLASIGFEHKAITHLTAWGVDGSLGDVVIDDDEQQYVATRYWGDRSTRPVRRLQDALAFIEGINEEES